MLRRTSIALTLLALLTSALLTSVATAQERATILLDHWETGRAARDGAVPAKLTAGVPRLPLAAAQEDVLARTVVDVPAAVASNALVLELERVRWDASVSLDGKVVASGLEGSARVDLGLVTPGKHQLLVRARDVRAAGAAGRKATDDDSVEAGWTEPLGDPPRLAGVLGDARLVERLAVEVVSIDVRPASDGRWSSTQRGPGLVLELEGVTGETADVGFVSSGLSPERHASVTLAPGARTTLALDWPEAPRWKPGSHERASVDVLVAGRVVRREKLAARTVGSSDERFMIDGVPVPFFVVEAPRGEGEPAAKNAIARARAVGANVIASNGERDDAWLETVEAAGLFVLYESELGYREPGHPLAAYALEDERLWRALRKQVLAAVERHRARPSIVAWGLARGVLADGGAGLALARERLAELAADVRRADGSRAVLLPRDDGRSLGVFPAWLPAESAEPGTIALLPPASTPRDLARRVGLAGAQGFLEDALVDVAHAEARAALALEARARGAWGVDVGPAPADEGAQRELARALAPLVLVPRPALGGGELVGSQVRRAFALVSDQGGEASVAVTWSLSWTSPTAPAGLSGKLVRETRPGTRATFEVSFEAPPTSARLEGVLHVAAVASGEQALVHEPFVVWPARSAPLALARRVLLLDAPSGVTGDALLDAGVAWREAPASPAELERESVLVLGEGALDEKALREHAVALVERARRVGAGVLVLRQTTAYPPGVAPPFDGLEPRGARRLAATVGAASLLALDSRDLEGWPGELLPPPGLARSHRADARVLVQAAPAGLEDACAIVACEDGFSEELLCQLPLASRARTLPAARALLQELVRASGERVVKSARPLFARSEPEVLLTLEQLALPPRTWTVEAIDAAAEPVILLDDQKLPPLSPRELESIENAVARGGTLVVTVGADVTLARLGALAAPGLKVEKAPALPAPLPWGPRELSALDLLWPPGPGQLRELGSRFDSAPRAAKLEGATVLVAPGALLERPFGSGRVLFDLVRWREALNQPIGRHYLIRLLRTAGAETREPPIRLPATAWGGVGRSGDTIQFFSNSTATARFLARCDGRYRVTLELGGTPSHGGWPLARLHCDAQYLGELSVEGPGPARYEREVVVPAGFHVLSLSFVNDAFEAPEDRNMWFQGAVLELLPPTIY